MIERDGVFYYVKHIPKAKKGLTLLDKLRRTVTKGRTAATKGKALLKLGKSKPFPNTLVNATQKSKLLQTQRNNLMLRGGKFTAIDKTLPWHSGKNLLQRSKQLAWEGVVSDIALGGDLGFTKLMNLKNRRLKIKKEKALRQEENEIAAAQIQMDGDNQLAMQEAEGARLAKELQLKEEARIKAEQLKNRNELNTKEVIPPKSNVNDSKVTKLKNKARVLPINILTQGKSTLKSNRKELNKLLLGK